MRKYSKILIQKYFDEHSLVASNIESFNYFVEKELQIIIEENKIIEPTIIPHNIDEFKIRLDKIWVTKPEITEAKPLETQPKKEDIPKETKKTKKETKKKAPRKKTVKENGDTKKS